MEYTLFIVDDDPHMRAALARQLRMAGFPVEAHASAEGFLRSHDPGTRGVLILDLRMPGMDGLTLQRHLAERSWLLPVIVISGDADVPSAVAAMQLGAEDVLEKPFDEGRLLVCITRAIRHDTEMRKDEAARLVAERQLTRLTAAERRIVDLLCAGHSTKQIASLLELSIRTVDAHRRNIKRKTQARSLPEIIALGMHARSQPGHGRAAS